MTFAEDARRLFGLCARVLGWRPDDFWAATPAELAAIFEPDRAVAAMSRDDLNAMMERECDG